MTSPTDLPPRKSGSIAPLLGAVGFVIALSAAWLLVRPSDPTGLPLPPWIPPVQPEVATAPPVVAPGASDVPAEPSDASLDADPATASASDLVSARLDLDRKKMIALARLGPDFEAKVDALYADAHARAEAVPAKVASGELSPEQAHDELERVRRDFGDAMIAALPPSVLERIRQGDGGREQP